MDLLNPQKYKSRQIIVSLILIDVLLILTLIIFRNFLKNNLDENEYKLLWEIALITIGGGFIGLAFETLKREQELREARRQYFRDFYSKAVSEYNKVKKCRRMLRAKAIYKVKVNEKEIEYVKTNECIPILTELEDSQLEFEGLVKEIEKSSLLFTEKKMIKEIFTSMENYLGGVLKKFEDGNYNGLDSKVLHDFDDKVEEFTRHYKEEQKVNAPFFCKFANPFDEARGLLINDIQKA